MLICIKTFEHVCVCLIRKREIRCLNFTTNADVFKFYFFLISRFILFCTKICHWNYHYHLSFCTSGGQNYGALLNYSFNFRHFVEYLHKCNMNRFWTRGSEKHVCIHIFHRKFLPRGHLGTNNNLSRKRNTSFDHPVSRNAANRKFLGFWGKWKIFKNKC